MIKFEYQSFWSILSGLIYAAEKHQIPIALNAVGVEGFDDTNQRCKILKDALNQSCVKIVTTRDDFTTLQNLYFKNNFATILKKVADPAVHASSTYGCKRDKNSNTIGIGLIRSAIFRANGLDIDRDSLVELYSNIVIELELKGYSWEFFTNGLPVDEELQNSILQKLNRNVRNTKIRIPETGEALVNIIAGYKGIIAARLHASIIAFSLSIPAIGLVWNQKSVFFGDEIGHPERFITHENYFAPYIVNCMERALKEGYSDECTEQIKRSAIESVHMTISVLY